MTQDHKGNPDSEGLGWYGDDRLVIGRVDEVNGLGAVEIPGFVATRHELIQLAKYWAGIEIDLYFCWFMYGQTGSSEIRIGPFASRRIARIAQALGEEVAAEAVRAAHSEFASERGVDPRTWNIFLNGTPEERRALQNKIEREMNGTEAVEIAEATALTDFLRSLGVNCLMSEPGKPVRFAILPFSTASVTDPLCIIVPVLHYLNAGASDGRYEKNDDGFLPPIQWAVRYVGLSPIEINQIQSLSNTGEFPCDLDIVMRRTDAASGREFYRASNKARWKVNPDLATEVRKAAGKASKAFSTKLVGKAGVTMFDNFQAASATTGKL